MVRTDDVGRHNRMKMMRMKRAPLRLLLWSPHAPCHAELRK